MVSLANFSKTSLRLSESRVHTRSKNNVETINWFEWLDSFFFFLNWHSYLSGRTFQWSRKAWSIVVKDQTRASPRWQHRRQGRPCPFSHMSFSSGVVAVLPPKILPFWRPSYCFRIASQNEVVFLLQSLLPFCHSTVNGKSTGVEAEFGKQCDSR